VAPRLNKLASSRRNTRKNSESKQTTPVSDHEKILKARGSLKPTTTVYQLKYPQPNTKTYFEPLTSHNSPPETINSFLAISKVKGEIHRTTSVIQKDKNPTVNLSAVNILPTLHLDFSTSLSLKEYTIHSDSTPVGSPNYITCKSEEPSPRIPYHPSLFFLSHKEAKDSLLVFQKPLYNTSSPYPVVLMEVAGGGGGGSLGGGMGGQGPPTPPRFFAKVAMRYVPLILPIPLHELPENYIKRLPKFTREGDLTTTEHINFFDQFADILGLDHKDVYSRLFVQTFKGQVRTWFQSLPAGSILSYNSLEDSFLRQWGERKNHLYYLTEFGSLKKKNSEIFMEFIQIFNKMYNKIPAEVKPSQLVAKVTFMGYFELDFALLLRER
jgi:hypothetical protein